MTAQPRIDQLANLPLFHRLGGRKAVVVGTSAGADWKAELLAAAGAKVVRLGRKWRPEQLTGAALAVGEFADSEQAAAFARDARSAGALVNMIDRPELCDVTFGTIVNRSPVVIGISTDGASPMLGQSIRARIETVLPARLSRWAEIAKQWRAQLKQQVGDFGQRRAFWQRFVAAAWAAANFGFQSAARRSA